MIQIHATCIDLNGIGVLLTGASGSGKSDLALRLIDNGARLVADDRVDLTQGPDHLIVQAPENLFNLIEVRGLGILRLNALKSTQAQLVIKLVPVHEVDRLPEEATETFFGIELPCFKVAAFENSAPLKVQLAADMVSGSIMRVDD